MRWDSNPVSSNALNEKAKKIKGFSLMMAENFHYFVLYIQSEQNNIGLNNDTKQYVCMTLVRLMFVDKIFDPFLT